VVKRLTRMPVCIDPSHSVGLRGADPDGLSDIFHAAAQGIVSGANLVLTDIHPEPRKALVDGAQALSLEELPAFLEDCAIAREAYLKRRSRLTAGQRQETQMNADEPQMNADECGERFRPLRPGSAKRHEDLASPYPRSSAFIRVSKIGGRVILSCS
jgi:hypothetical protein